MTAQLMDCAYRGDIDQLETLINQQAVDVMAIDEQGLTALFYAVLGHRQEVGAMLLEHGGRDLALATAGNGVACLYLACQNGNLEMARLLADVGGHDLIHRTTLDGCSCLYIASQQGHVDIVEDLMMRSPELQQQTLSEHLSVLLHWH